LAGSVERWQALTKSSLTKLLQAVQGNRICPFRHCPLHHCEERLRRGNPGQCAKTLVHVALDCRAEAGSQ